MSYYALSCLGDALAATKAFLLPVDRGRWLRLAVVVFFLSGGSGFGSVSTAGSNTSPSAATGTAEVPTLPAVDLVAILAVVGVVVALGVLYVLVGAVMQFVLVDSLRREQIRVRKTFRRQFRKGLSLFAFQLVVGIVTVAILGGAAFLLIVPATAGSNGVGLVFGILGFMALFFVVFLVAALVNVFTVDFVVPTMVQTDRGLIGSWRRFWPVFRQDLEQFAVYVLVRIGVAIAVGLVGGTVVGIAAVIVAVPFFVVGGIAVAVTGFSLSPAVFGLLGGLLVAYLLVLFAVVALVHVPLKTYVRYFQLLVLGDADPDLDLIPDRRAAVRSPQQ
jgi:hypothetical protein